METSARPLRRSAIIRELRAPCVDLLRFARLATGTYRLGCVGTDRLGVL
jgi:hypothetical protein